MARSQEAPRIPAPRLSAGDRLWDGRSTLANEASATFNSRCQEHWLAGIREKLGISGHEDSDLDLVRDLLRAMRKDPAEFTLTFRRLCALRRLCLRRPGALHGSEIQVEQGLLFVALVLVLPAQAQDLPEDFHIEALSLGLC